MEVGQIVQFGGQFGPLLVVIALLFRSNAKKDAIIETLTRQALEMAHQTRNAAQAASVAVRAAEKAIEDH